MDDAMKLIMQLVTLLTTATVVHGITERQPQPIWILMSRLKCMPIVIRPFDRV